MSPDLTLLPDPEVRAQVARARVDGDERFLAMAEAAAVGFERLEALSAHVAGLRLSESDSWSPILAIEITAADAALHAEALRTEAVHGPLRDRPANLEGFVRDCYLRRLIVSDSVANYALHASGCAGRFVRLFRTHHPAVGSPVARIAASCSDHGG